MLFSNIAVYLEVLHVQFLITSSSCSFWVWMRLKASVKQMWCNKSLSEVQLVLGDQVCLTVSVHHKSVGWVWGWGSVQANQVVPHQSGKTTSLWSCLDNGDTVMLKLERDKQKLLTQSGKNSFVYSVVAFRFLFIWNKRPSQNHKSQTKRIQGCPHFLFLSTHDWNKLCIGKTTLCTNMNILNRWEWQPGENSWSILFIILTDFSIILSTPFKSTSVG